MDLLSQLRDVHFPKAISFWPLAMGWYILMATIVAISCLTLFLYYRHRQKTKVKRMILRKISLMRQDPATNHSILLEELSILLKRAALYAFPREEVASLSGDSWLKFLDKNSPMTNAFTNGVGKMMGTAPYQEQHSFQKEELFLLIETWVKKNL